MISPFYERFSKPILWATAVLLPVLIWGAAAAVHSTSNRVIDWLPKNFEETKRLFWFFDRFGLDEILVVSWPECTLDSPGVKQFTQALRSDQPVPGRDLAFFREVINGQEVFDQLTSDPLNLPEETAFERMQGWILGPDNRTTCVVARIQMNEDSTFSRIAACDFVQSTAKRLGIPTRQLRVAGPTVDSVAIDLAGNRGMNLLRLLSVVVGSTIAWVSLREWRQVAVVFATSLVATFASLAAVHFTGFRMDAVLLPLPALIFVLSTSGAIHLTHYYNAAVRDQPLKMGPTLAIRAGWLPCTLASLTTMVGLASLTVSRILPVARFGGLSALGVGLGLICLLTVWPALAQLVFIPRQRSTKQAANSWWMPIFRFSTAARRPLLLVTVIGLPLLCIGLARINTSVRLSSLLPKNSPLLESYGWFEKQIGPLVPVEVILQFPALPDDGPSVMFDRAVTVEQLRQRIEAMEGTRGTFAATTFVPELPVDTGVRQIMLRRVLRQRIFGQRDLLLQHGLIAWQPGEELWRISTRVTSNQSDYGPFIDELNSVVDSFVADNLAKSDDPPLQASVCGSVPLIQRAQRELLLDLFKSFMIAFGLIGLTMMLMLRNPVGGALSMVPNVFPSMLVLGTMGFTGQLVDIGMMMTASVALGIAVDDTMHFLVWYQRDMARGKSQRQAVRGAFRHSATAMLQTSLICGFGMLPYVASDFGPVFRFSGGMMALLMAALLGDLLLLPAILTSPLGRYFMPLSIRASHSHCAADTAGVPTS